jgi:hypothetical protein
VTDSVDEYFAMLKDAAARRYPEHWRSYKADLNIDLLDEVYGQFRNVAAENVPVEERERARCFGTFIGDAYSPAMIARINEIGGSSPWDLLAERNSFLGTFNLDLSRSARPIP